ncbi:MAG TPA: lysophospholipid acyltransferase family protein [Clostridia bacterium]|nr:lysophospholipid acyltransferase family protein [Clostridia bacterium]
MANDSFQRFDMLKKPRRQMLRPLIWALSFPPVWKHRAKIVKQGMDGLKPPYLLLCNHNAFFDFMVASVATFPHRSNSVVAIDAYTMPMGKGFTGRAWLLRMVGCICKRKFTNDLVLVRHIKRVIENGDIAVVYPEARYSLCGTTAVLPESLGKMCKLLKVPVVTLVMHGHHINSPFWNPGDRGVKPTEAEMVRLFTADELAKKSVEEINESIRKAFYYDDFAWQKAHGIRVTEPNRAERLHKVLYQCPACKMEYRMGSKGEKLFCEACGKTWTMSEYGELSADNGETEFSHIPDWYEWERQNVRAEVEKGAYGIRCDVRVTSLPNSKGYIPLGMGTLTHDHNGFTVKGTGEYGDFEMKKPVSTMYSCHIEYEYLNCYGDALDLSTLEDTWFIYPQGRDFSLTKFALATEELYEAYKSGASYQT